MAKSPYFQPEHHLFRQSVRTFMDREVRPHLAQWENDRRIPRDIWRRMGELGFLGIDYPEAYGGMAADFFYSVVFLEEVARAGSGGFAAAVGVHEYVSVAHLNSIGSEDLKQRYLAPAVRGEKIGALAISEPDAGSNVAGLRTTLRREGDHYVLNGSKTFITNGVHADFIVVACQAEAGLSLVVVDAPSEGLSRTQLDKMGWHCSDTAELSFDQVRVPLENLVGEEGMGFYYIMSSFQLERLIMGIMGVAGMDLALHETLRYMNEREAFGRSIAKYQALRHRIADVATEIEAARQFTYHTCWLHGQGEFAVRECSMVKLYVTELGTKVADACLQMFGGYGYMEAYPLARMYRDARVGTIAGGTSEIMREIIAKLLFEETAYQSSYSH
jgi:acyl-CoA dehydrogenase